jgi:hypothetical protein
MAFHGDARRKVRASENRTPCHESHGQVPGKSCRGAAFAWKNLPVSAAARDRDGENP